MNCQSRRPILHCILLNTFTSFIQPSFTSFLGMSLPRGNAGCSLHHASCRPWLMHRSAVATEARDRPCKSGNPSCWNSTGQLLSPPAMVPRIELRLCMYGRSQRIIDGIGIFGVRVTYANHDWYDPPLQGSDVHISRCAAKLTCYYVRTSDDSTFEHTTMMH